MENKIKNRHEHMLREKDKLQMTMSNLFLCPRTLRESGPQDTLDSCVPPEPGSRAPP